MIDPGPIRVVVELERTQRTISGKLTVVGAASSEFFGWLELIDLLERISLASEATAETE